MTNSTSRREFLRRAGALGGMGAAAPWALNLAAIGAAGSLSAIHAHAQSAADDYRALVCVFLYGGNDNHNTVVPYDEGTYQRYLDIRGSIALPRDSLSLTELVPSNPWPDARRMALHPSLAPLKTLFDEGKVALAMNVGTLEREGTTLDDFKAGRGLPPKLFSHNDQQSVWQSLKAEGATYGWGGRMADLLAAADGSATFASISAAGNAVFMSGQRVVQYQVGPEGSIALETVFGSAGATDALRRLMQRGGSANLFEAEHARIASRSFAADAQVRAALAPVTVPAFPDTSLGAQLRIVARLIAARAGLGAKRQVFFVSQGGFDNHDGLIDKHPGLLGSVADAMKAFYDATVAMGMQNSVTAFTGADFGRTLANNGDGSDHGWGSYHLVVGGAVQPKAWVGRLPSVSVVADEHNVGGGRLLPAIGVDQYGATLARWFGVADSDMAEVFPRIGNYSVRDLGFMPDYRRPPP